MGLEEDGFQKVCRKGAAKMLRRVRAAYPQHPFQETDFEGMYRRPLPFYRRYLDYTVKRIAGSWGFYASEDDVVLRFLPGQERAEWIVNRRDPIHLTEQNVPYYVHRLHVGSPGYYWDADILTFYPDTPQIHRAMVREYVRLPRLDHVDAQGVFWVNLTRYVDWDPDEKPCSRLIEECLGVHPDGTLLHGSSRTLVNDLRAYIVYRL
jgi:hypothetical protein